MSFNIEIKTDLGDLLRENAKAMAKRQGPERHQFELADKGFKEAIRVLDKVKASQERIGIKDPTGELFFAAVGMVLAISATSDDIPKVDTTGFLTGFMMKTLETAERFGFGDENSGALPAVVTASWSNGVFAINIRDDFEGVRSRARDAAETEGEIELAAGQLKAEIDHPPYSDHADQTADARRQEDLKAKIKSKIETLLQEAEAHAQSRRRA